MFIFQCGLQTRKQVPHKYARKHSYTRILSS